MLPKFRLGIGLGSSEAIIFCVLGPDFERTGLVEDEDSIGLKVRSTKKSSRLEVNFFIAFSKSTSVRALDILGDEGVPAALMVILLRLLCGLVTSSKL